MRLDVGDKAIGPATGGFDHNLSQPCFDSPCPDERISLGHCLTDAGKVVGKVVEIEKGRDVNISAFAQRVPKVADHSVSGKRTSSSGG